MGIITNELEDFTPNSWRIGRAVGIRTLKRGFACPANSIAGVSGFEPEITVLSQKYLAGPRGLEPLRTVLETVMLPLHHGPMCFALLRTSGSRTSKLNLRFSKMVLGETPMIPFHYTPSSLCSSGPGSSKSKLAHKNLLLNYI